MSTTKRRDFLNRYHVQEWEKLNETFELVVADEFDDFVNTKFVLKNRPYRINENVKLSIIIRNDSEKEIPTGTMIKFQANSYFCSKVVKTKAPIEPESSNIITVELYPQDNVTVKNICENLEYSITTPSSSVIEKGKIKFWASDFGQEIISYRPPACSIVQSLNIAFFGIIGSGKSSFLNRFVSVVEGLTSNANRYFACATTAKSGNHVTTRIEKVLFSTILQELRDFRIALVDTFGVSERTFNDPALFPSWLRGMLGESFEMSESTMNRTIDRSEQNQIHSLVFLLAQGDRGDQNHTEKLKKFYQEALQYGYQPLVIITKMDEVTNETKQQVIEQVSALIGANADTIFATENYHGGNMENVEAERNFDIDKETLIILLKLIERGNLFIKTNKSLRKD